MVKERKQKATRIVQKAKARYAFRAKSNPRLVVQHFLSRVAQSAQDMGDSTLVSQNLEESSR